eukprot:TRINITY_DN2864_c0_g1_i5.p1 TRINITY_DN2864_c0_g1~~TRINITY_DN2864_c0_g1_i5.p1  ORF type:complete len:259 (-),score=63.38 TRINITY_DN2864_c0_g1_i5:811-1587(-)
MSGCFLLLLALLSATAESQIPHLVCLNPVIQTGVFEDKPFSTDWALVQAHVHQRHLDRWIYAHPLINNHCWPAQLNSTSHVMTEQCNYNLSSVWEHFGRSPDPYAYPEFGSCNAKQLTKQGIQHAQALGKILRKQYVDLHQIIPGTCPEDSVGLECDEAQKNQQTTQNEYYGLCNRLPSTSEFPAFGVLDTHMIEKGRPFWSSPSICNNTRHDERGREEEEKREKRKRKKGKEKEEKRKRRKKRKKKREKRKRNSSLS